MKLSDFLIIYLACGAPVGVYFFLGHRNKQNSVRVYLQSFALVFVWIPYAARLLHDFITKRFPQIFPEKPAADKPDDLQKRISQILFDSDLAIPVFEFREVIERYTGLTIAKNLADNQPSKADEEIFRVALRQNIKLGAKCLHRRNLLRIARHQTLARADFLQLVRELSFSVSETKKLRSLTIEFVKTLGDADAQKSLDEIFNKTLQSGNENCVRHSEKELWTATEHKQLSASKMPVRLRTLTATRKD